MLAYTGWQPRENHALASEPLQRWEVLIDVPPTNLLITYLLTLNIRWVLYRPALGELGLPTKDDIAAETTEQN